VALHAQQHDGIRAPLHFRGPGHGGYWHRFAALGPVQHQPGLAERGQVLAAGHQSGGESGEVQMSADHAADGARAEDDVPHRSDLLAGE
jgi:hypothetical protein